MVVTQRMKRCGAVIGAVLLALMLVLAIGRGEVAEASVDSCLSSSGAADVPSVQNACRLCYSSGLADSRGALWINGSSTERNSATIDISEADDDKVVNMYLWGQVYSCRSWNALPNVASYIWIGGAGQMVGNGQDLRGAVSYVMNNNASMSLYRGTGLGRLETWFQPLSGNLAMQLDVKQFKEAAGTTHTTEDDPVLGTVEVYRATVSVNRCNNTRYGKYVNTSGAKTGTCYGDDSEIVLRIIKDGSEKPEEAEAEFYATSSFEIDELAGVYPQMSGESQNDGMTRNGESGEAAWAEFSVDYDVAVVPVKFWHNITYVNGHEFEGGDVVPEAKTAWKVSGELSRSENGELSVDAKAKELRSGNLSAQTVEVRLEQGETKTVCQTISYEPKWVNFRSEDGVVYSEDGAGSGQSQACVRITRAMPPEGVPWTQGETRVQNMYVGETAELGWRGLSMKSTKQLRVTGMQSMVYLVPADTQWSEGLTTGGKLSDASKSLSPCTWIEQKAGLGAVKCEIVDAMEMGWGQSNAYTKQEVVAVPNLVGYKYCNSAGYFVEHWRLVCGKHGCTWVHDSWKDYWDIYDSACRTIAKKPSVAVWNGGLFVDMDLKGVLAVRYTAEVDDLSKEVSKSLFGAMGTSVEALNADLVSRLGEGGDARAVFGSWTEYLTVATGEVNGFTSGASLSRGGTGGTTTESYSTLTIANDGGLGKAEVSANPALRERLFSYLRDNAGVVKGDSVAEVYQKNGGFNETKVITVSGDLTIEDNIVRSGSEYSDIFKIPQVVIFVDGDVKIAGNVERIDAWIVAAGKIDTCAEFREETQTRAVGYEASGAVTCDKQLVFNGAVVAAGAALHRTFGADTELSERYAAAEVFDLSAENYLWAYAQAGRYGSSFREAYTRELAPRY